MTYYHNPNPNVSSGDIALFNRQPSLRSDEGMHGDFLSVTSGLSAECCHGKSGRNWLADTRQYQLAGFATFKDTHEKPQSLGVLKQADLFVVATESAPAGRSRWGAHYQYCR